MDLVDEQQHVAGVHDLLDDLLQTFLELAAVLRAGHERRDVQCDEALVAQDVGHLVGHDELRQALGDGGFAHTGLAQNERVVLLAAREDLHDAFDFRRAADDRIQLALAGLLGEIGAELGEHGIRRAHRAIEARAPGVDRRLAHKIVQRPAHIVAGDVQAAQHLERRALALAHDTEQQVLRGDVGLPHLHGLDGVLVDGDHLADGLNDAVVADVQAVERLGGKTVLLLDEAEQDMLGAHVGLVKRARLILSQDKHFTRLVREFLE